MTPNRERTYEAIYAAAFVREFASLSGPFGPMMVPERAMVANQRAHGVADAWLEMVQTAEGNGGDV